MVDHVAPHMGDTRLMWDAKNLQSMTKQCHDGGKQTKERSGNWPGCDEDGNPFDPDHEWNNSDD